MSLARATIWTLRPAPEAPHLSCSRDSWALRSAPRGPSCFLLTRPFGRSGPRPEAPVRRGPSIPSESPLVGLPGAACPAELRARLGPSVFVVT